MLGLRTGLLLAIALGGGASVQDGPARPAAEGETGGYLVVCLGLSPANEEHQRFRKVADEVAAFHEAERHDFARAETEALRDLLAESLPENVLFVIPPEHLDINLHRRILLSSAKLDEDVLPDFAFGYFTHRTGAGLEELWRRTKTLHQKGLADRSWVSAFVTSGIKSTIWQDYCGELEKAAGFAGPGIGFAIRESDPDVLAFVIENLGRLEKASVIQLTGNGDPQGIWLFDDRRNIDSERHWPYAPDRVGHDPEGEMPRITAQQVAALALSSPIVWSGTCHSAATRRVFVEGDIVSTFGTSDRVTCHELSPEKSLCLAILDAGAAAFLAPIAANHGFSVDLESSFALRHGASLGETIKSTWDDVFLAASGNLELNFVEPGALQPFDEPVMQGGGANRILIGDPALRVFSPTEHPGERKEIVDRGERGFDVVLDWDEGFHFREWDLFGTDHRDWRIGERVDVTELVPAGASIETSVTVTEPDGTPLSYTLFRSELESFHGRRYLHLQANANREVGQGLAKRAAFHVRITERE